MVSPKKILITGARGILGPYLTETLTAIGQIRTTALGGGDRACDLNDPASVSAMIDDFKPDVVVHAAAMTDVDRCEAEPALADRLNRLATAILAAALPAPTRLVYLSTDQVYSNTTGPHVVGREGPINEYGRSKLAGEIEALNRLNSLVLRLNFFGPSRTMGRNSLSDFVIQNLSANKQIDGYIDVLFSPLFTGTVAEVLGELIVGGATGVVNLGSHNGISKYEFARTVARHKKLNVDLISPGKSMSEPGKTPRPLDLRMNVSDTEATLGHALPTIAEEIEKL